MTLKRGKKRLSVVLLLMVMVISIGLLMSGCVRGLTPVGWSGGAVSGDILYVGSTEGRLVMINVDDESRQWSDPLRNPSQGGLFGCGTAAMGGGCGGAAGVAIYGTPAVSGEFVYIAGYNGKVYAYNTGTLTFRWSYPTLEEYVEPFVGGIAVEDERLFIGSSDGMVYALDATNGTLLWTYLTEDRIWATPAVHDGTIYIGSFDKNLYALNASDGSLKWKYLTEGSVISTPLIDNGAIYFGSFDKYIYALNISDGSLKWKYSGENWFWGKPIIHDGIIYAGCLDGKVYAIRASTGNIVNDYELGDAIASSPVIINDSVIFATKEGGIYAIDTVSGGQKTLGQIEKQEIHGPLTAYEGIVYIHTQDMMLHRINAINGAVLRTISLQTP